MPVHIDPVQQAKAFFENGILAVAVDSSDVAFLQKSGTIHWEDAVSRLSDAGTYVFVPLEPRADLYSGEVGKVGTYRIYSQLRASATEGGSWVFDLITYIPEGHGWETSGGFTGTALAQRWGGGAVRKVHFYNGKLLKNGRTAEGHATKMM